MERVCSKAAALLSAALESLVRKPVIQNSKTRAVYLHDSVLQVIDISGSILDGTTKEKPHKVFVARISSKLSFMPV
jgi:hypothetical protein